ncbi:hypothetical protein F7725_010597 [Dissostichus mawsoni]|uniref:Uncharacterized protein n=1 Tax=Dissostichus mawsoni TaxID=36200 RepID=A0A7J5XQH2_DISMA|nr:hypothetical protein F7725_010597 [Dissostichus mawsoni]
MSEMIPKEKQGDGKRGREDVINLASLLSCGRRKASRRPGGNVALSSCFSSRLNKNAAAECRRKKCLLNQL